MILLPLALTEVTLAFSGEGGWLSLEVQEGLTPMSGALVGMAGRLNSAGPLFPLYSFETLHMVSPQGSLISYRETQL